MSEEIDTQPGVPGYPGVAVEAPVPASADRAFARECVRNLFGLDDHTEEVAVFEPAELDVRTEWLAEVLGETVTPAMVASCFGAATDAAAASVARVARRLARGL
jgi:hypothetical protein